MATVPTYIYGDTANAVLNAARSRVDDLILTPAGSPTGADPGQQLTQVGGANLLAELNPDSTLCLRTQIIFNSAYRKFQEYLANLGYRLLSDTKNVLALPVNAAADLSAQSWLSWNGFFNGTTFTSSPVLPADLYAPLIVKERVAGNGVFQPMTVALQGLATLPARTILNRQWIWRNNALYLTGASGLTDLQIQYEKFWPDLVANSPLAATPWYYQLIPFPRSLSCLAWYVAYEVLVPRIGEAAAALCLMNAQDEADKIFNNQAKLDRRVPQVVESLPRPGAAGFPDGTGGVQARTQ